MIINLESEKPFLDGVPIKDMPSLDCRDAVKYEEGVFNGFLQVTINRVKHWGNVFFMLNSDIIPYLGMAPIKIRHYSYKWDMRGEVKELPLAFQVLKGKHFFGTPAVVFSSGCGVDAYIYTYLKRNTLIKARTEYWNPMLPIGHKCDHLLIIRAYGKDVGYIRMIKPEDLPYGKYTLDMINEAKWR